MSSSKTQHGLLKTIILAMMLTNLSAANSAIAQDWISAPHLKTRIEFSNHRIPDQTLQLNESVRPDVRTVAIELMRNVYQVPESIEIVTVSPLASPTGSPSIDFTFAHDSVPFCDARVSARQGKGLLPLILGTLPVVSGNLPTREDFASIDAIAAWQHALNKLLQQLDVAEVTPTADVRSCIAINRHFEAVPSLETTVHADGKPFKLRFDENEIYHWSPLFFEATGTASVFARNSNNGTLTSETLTGLAGDGDYLIDNYFRERVWQLNNGVETDVAGVRSSTSNFVYSPSTQTQLFGEVSIFRNARRAQKFFADHGLTDSVTGLFKLIVHAQFNVRGTWTSDNALYTPGSGTSTPYISIGDGSGTILKNLSTDADVVTHEYAHHWVFKTLKSTSGAAAEIHEGLADFATMLLNDDPCFAPSICPANSSSCFKVAQCLRHADHQLKYLDSNMPAPFHQRGQVLSGMLWDLRLQGTIGLQTMRTIFFKSLAYLPADAGYKDVVLALTAADQDNLQGAHVCQIFDAAVQRQLIAASEDECKYPKQASDTSESVVPDDTISTGGAGTAESVTKEKANSTVEADPNIANQNRSGQGKSPSGTSFCGVVGSPSSSHSTIYWLLVPIIVPTLLSRRRSKSTA